MPRLRYERSNTSLSWVKCGRNWCPFETVDLSSVSGKGVYVIWSGKGPTRRVVYVGNGDIADRIEKHRQDKRIMAHKGKGLWVTWAKPGQNRKDRREGIERYLADELDPLEGPKHPDVDPIPVNLPWD